MSKTAVKDWRREFGVAKRKPPRFFSHKDEIATKAQQGHLLRRAFDVLKLDGILCADHSPLAYFKIVKRITPQAVFELHRKFWNHSGASLLVLITDDRVHIYSGMTRPEPPEHGQTDLPSLVKTLDRASEGLKEFIVAVESGEFFHQHRRSFDPTQRVDRHLLDNLQNTRTKLDDVAGKPIPPNVLDALLCRLAFTCYLFDRKVIGQSYLKEHGITSASDLRDLLSLTPPTKAKDALYKLFEALRRDFNGDLFSNDLSSEERLIKNAHVAILRDFFRGTDVITRQTSLFWPYDFEFIPIETISAIYERFLDASDQKQGAFYTPRFLAEVVLDTALEDTSSLIGKRYLDPACGSGIFLVGLFNRIAEEWKQANPRARNDRRATELMRLLRSSLFGVDISRTACYITAFSLYLAYLDQLTPPDIQALQAKGKALPQLVSSGNDFADRDNCNILCTDFFAENAPIPEQVDLVVGNPPWGSIATTRTPASVWCKSHDLQLPDKQIAAAFSWKAARHVTGMGRICFLLPHGILFNHSKAAIGFQKAWVQAHQIERVLNLTDLRFLLFEKAIHPAIVASYRKKPPITPSHRIEYWTPKADWTTTQAEVITISPQDRTHIEVGELLKDLESPDAPQIWKSRHWASPRDWRLLDRLLMLPRLRDIVSQPRQNKTPNRWLIAEGFQPIGASDDPDKAKVITVPNRHFIGASDDAIDLFLLPGDCQRLESTKVTVRSKSNKNTQVFRCPHVLVTKGFNNIAFADFDVCFRHALRGITGPREDRELLMFLAAYLRSPLARYFTFHTSSNWGIYRPEVHVEELLRIPFPLPHQASEPKRAKAIVGKVARLIESATTASETDFLQRSNVIHSANAKVEELVSEYFDVLPREEDLIRDTFAIIEPSIQPTRSKMPIATLTPASIDQCKVYLDRVLEMLNGWNKRNKSKVHGQVMRSETLGIAVAVLEKRDDSQSASALACHNEDLIHVLDKLRQSIPSKHATLDIVRGVIVFDHNRLYLVKPIGQRYWSLTAAMNDADEIASTILMRTSTEAT